MNKAIGAAVWAWAVVVLCAVSYIPASAQQTTTQPEDMARYKQALELMQAPPMEHSGHNIWVALVTWQQPNLSPDQRQALADDYAAQVKRWYEGYVADYLNDKIDQKMPPLPQFPGKRTLPSARDSVLCGFGTRVADCLATVREQPQAIREALAPYNDLIEQVADLSEYNYYHVPLPQHGNTQWPDFRFVRLPLSVHALAHVQGDSQTALAGLCRDANTGLMLLRHSTDLLVSMVGRRILADNMEVAAQIIAELPLEASLPENCQSAFAPLPAEDISLCLAMRGEFAFMRSYMELEKQRLERNQTPVGNEQLSDWDNALLVYAQRNSAMCLPQIQQTLLKDEKFALPPLPAFTWVKQCKDDNPACLFAQINGPDYSTYVHRMQDTAAQLQMMQVLLWLRQHPVKPLTSDYLQSAVPADVYTSTQRSITISQDGSALEADTYAERAPGPLRLLLPQALR